MSEACLIDKKCIPCTGGVPPLPSQKIEVFLKELGDGWKINAQGHLTKEFVFEDFLQPMDLANRIAKLAEEEAHHPDLTIAWGRCSVEIWTHKINGLTESDFILASKIEALV